MRLQYSRLAGLDYLTLADEVAVCDERIAFDIEACADIDYREWRTVPLIMSGAEMIRLLADEVLRERISLCWPAPIRPPRVH
jgi:hypothetical protein